MKFFTSSWKNIGICERLAEILGKFRGFVTNAILKDIGLVLLSGVVPLFEECVGALCGQSGNLGDGHLFSTEAISKTKQPKDAPPEHSIRSAGSLAFRLSDDYGNDAISDDGGPVLESPAPFSTTF